MRVNYAAQLMALDDERLEAFVNDWLTYRTRDYFASERWSGPSDLGRDVVGYATPQRHEGEWDNYQCKQLSQRLSESAALIELGKIFMHSANGEYSLPRAYAFVAPRGVVRNVRTLIAHPERFRRAFHDSWDERIARALVENQRIPLTDAIRAKIDAFNFAALTSLDAGQLVDDAHAKPVLVQWFGLDPGPSPRGTVPADIQADESSYIAQLVALYAEKSGLPLATAYAALEHPEWGHHLRAQRARFFDAAEFERYYRDSTPVEYVDNFKDEVYHGVVDVYGELHPDGLARVGRVMTQAASVSVSGVLGRHASPQVKQGTCHHFANQGRLPWKR